MHIRMRLDWVDLPLKVLLWSISFLSPNVYYTLLRFVAHCSSIDNYRFAKLV